MKTKLLLLVCFLISQTASAQVSDSITWNTGISFHFYQNGEKISAKKASAQLKTFPEAHASFQSARQNRTFSHFLGGIGLAGVVYTAYSLFPEGMETKWGIIAGSAVLIGFAVPLNLSADNQMCGALEYYNQQVNKSSYYHHKPKGEFSLVLNAGGAGFRYAF